MDKQRKWWLVELKSTPGEAAVKIVERIFFFYSFEVFYFLCMYML